MAQMVKNLPAMQDTPVQSLGWADMEKGMATHSQYSCLEEPGGLQSMESQSQMQLSDLTRDWITLLCTWNLHNIVNQLCFNRKKIFFW